MKRLSPHLPDKRSHLLTKEREAVHISEEQKRFLLVETLRVEDGNSLAKPKWQPLGCPSTDS